MDLIHQQIVLSLPESFRQCCLRQTTSARQWQKVGVAPQRITLRPCVAMLRLPLRRFTEQIQNPFRKYESLIKTCKHRDKNNN